MIKPCFPVLPAVPPTISRHVKNLSFRQIVHKRQAMPPAGQRQMAAGLDGLSQKRRTGVVSR